MSFVKMLGRVASGLILVFILQLTVIAQDKPVYAMVAYIKADRGKGGDYLELTKNYGQKLFQDRVNSGEILSWALYSVNMTTNPEDGYNFVGVTMSNSVGNFIEPKTNPQEFMKKLMPGLSDNAIQETLDKYGEVRVIQSALITQMIDGLPNDGSAKYYEINYMKVPDGKDAEYVALERDIYKPLHKERVAKGEITTWSLWGTPYPYSDARPYNYVTANGFSNWDKMFSSNYGETYKKVFPKGDMAKVNAQTGAARKMVKTEVWKLEYRTAPAK
jgi:hypothetical protein